MSISLSRLSLIFAVTASASVGRANEIVVYEGTYARDLEITTVVPKKERVQKCFLVVDPRPFRPGNPETNEVFFAGVIFGRDGGVMKQRRLFSPNLEQVKLGDVTTYAVTPDDVRAYVANRSYIGGSGLFAASARSSNGAFRNGQFFLKGDFTFKTRPTSADEIWYGPHYLTNEMPRKLNGAILDQVEQTAKDPVPTASQFFYQRAVFDLKRNETLSKAFTSETENTTVYEVVKALEATLTAQGYVK